VSTTRHDVLVPESTDGPGDTALWRGSRVVCPRNHDSLRSEHTAFGMLEVWSAKYVFLGSLRVLFTLRHEPAVHAGVLVVLKVVKLPVVNEPSQKAQGPAMSELFKLSTRVGSPTVAEWVEPSTAVGDLADTVLVESCAVLELPAVTKMVDPAPVVGRPAVTDLVETPPVVGRPAVTEVTEPSTVVGDPTVIEVLGACAVETSTLEISPAVEVIEPTSSSH
jgi:hypothetical protein